MAVGTKRGISVITRVLVFLNPFSPEASGEGRSAGRGQG